MMEAFPRLAALLRVGDRGPSVAQPQQALSRAATSADPKFREDGIFGPATQARLIAFQRSKGLVPDGVAGPLTPAALGSSDPPGPTVDPRPNTHLVSDLFGKNGHLDRSLVDAAAHVTLGTQGRFVQLIQFAALTLRGGVVPGHELNSFLYGPATADLIHTSKIRNKIINPALQKTADNIVGNRTIRKLDDDMVQVEREERLCTQRIASRAGGVA